MMIKADKILENRMRRALARQGYRLVKSRVRDPRAIDFGRYYIVDPDTNGIVAGGGHIRMTLPDVGRWATAAQ
jgi:hypothetical protein